MQIKKVEGIQEFLTNIGKNRNFQIGQGYIFLYESEWYKLMINTNIISLKIEGTGIDVIFDKKNKRIIEGNI